MPATKGARLATPIEGAKAAAATAAPPHALRTSTKPGTIAAIIRDAAGKPHAQEVKSLRAIRGVHLIELPGGGYSLTDEVTGQAIRGVDSKSHGIHLLETFMRGRTVDRALAPYREGRAPTPQERRAGQAIVRYRKITERRRAVERAAKRDEAKERRAAAREAALSPHERGRRDEASREEAARRDEAARREAEYKRSPRASRLRAAMATYAATQRRAVA